MTDEGALKTTDVDILMLPGLGNSGPDHWQRRWAERLSSARVVEQDDWERPEREAWVETIVRAAGAAERPVVLVAHSLGVSAVAHAAHRLPLGKVRGAFLVAPPDHERPGAPAETASFAPAPRDPLPFPSILVASGNDPYCAPDRAEDMAAAWGSDFHLAGEAGHINAASGHGPWPEGLMMFARLLRRLGG